MPIRTIPQVLTHNYNPEGPFLANLCDLPDDQAEAVLNRIRGSGKRSIKANYLRRRRETETWLIRERQRLLGGTPLSRPLYFFLGNFADGLDASRPGSIVIPLDAFPTDVLTFTYPDSMTSFSLGMGGNAASQRQPFHGQVFTLVGIENVIAAHGLPERQSLSDSIGKSDGYIETQIWDKRPILSFLSA